MQTGSSETLIGWKSGKNLCPSVGDRMQGASVATDSGGGGGSGWACTPTLTSQSWFFHHDGMYARNRHSSLCVCTLWSAMLAFVYVESYFVFLYTVTRIDGKLHQLHRVAQTKQSGWWEMISTFAMDIFGFFQHFRCKFSTVSKFSEYILYSKDGNFRLFVILRLHFLSKEGNFQLFVIFRFWFLFKGWNSPTFVMDIFGFSRWKSLRKLNSAGWARSSVLWHTSQVLYRCATLSLLWLLKKDINTFAVSLMNIVLVILCCRKRLSPK